MVMIPKSVFYKMTSIVFSVAPEECLYVGDGGSQELETARSFGMKTLQAGWFVKNEQEDWRKEGFASATEPGEVLAVLDVHEG